MRIWLTLALLALAAAVLSACGGSSEGPVAGGGPVSVPTATTRAAADGRGGQQGRADGRVGRSCAARGITVPPFNEGPCIQGGTRFVVANGRSLMRLRTMNVALRGFSVSEELRGNRKRARPQQGVFMLIRLGVKNTTSSPQRFAPGQTLLTIEQQQFNEAGNAELQVRPDALAFRGRDSIPPGGFVTGVVIFDLPVSQIERVTREGTLAVANFGAGAQRRQSEIGHFRIFLE